MSSQLIIGDSENSKCKKQHELEQDIYLFPKVSAQQNSVLGRFWQGSLKNL